MSGKEKIFLIREYYKIEFNICYDNRKGESNEEIN